MRPRVLHPGHDFLEMILVIVYDASRDSPALQVMTPFHRSSSAIFAIKL